jgi:hypothetical protein
VAFPRDIQGGWCDFHVMSLRGGATAPQNQAIVACELPIGGKDTANARCAEFVINSEHAAGRVPNLRVAREAFGAPPDAVFSSGRAGGKAGGKTRVAHKRKPRRSGTRLKQGKSNARDQSPSASTLRQQYPPRHARRPDRRRPRRHSWLALFVIVRCF